MSPRTRGLVLAGLAALGVGLVVDATGRPSPASSAPSYAGIESVHEAPPSLPAVEGPDRLGPDDGLVPGGVTAFDGGYPAVSRLDPALLDALRGAADAAAEDGVTIYVNSGWRSARYQQQLLDEAVEEHGADAARWVATVETSAHVSGDAVDVGRSEAAAWLSRHGARFGLCRTYDNEPWHYELRPDAVGGSCPRRYPDPTHDPRMRP
jgi:zinc D-Ala-D-Ala carboxypeptidase